MKKLSEFDWQETKRFVITLKSQLALITSDDDLKSAIKAIQDVRTGKETDKTYLDVAYAVFDSLLITNEKALDTIIAACMQISVEELQNANNTDVIEMVIDFLSIDTYKKLLSQGIKSATSAA